MKLLTLLLLFGISFAKAEDFPLSEERVSEIKSSLLEWNKIAEYQGAMSDSDYLEKLGYGLIKTSPTGPFTIGDRAGTHQAIKDKMLSIPGHAEFFGNKINHLYRNIKQAYADGKRTDEVDWSHYMTESMEAFKTLSMLPSHETVQVLGDMLSDDWKWPDYKQDSFFGTLDIYSLTFLSRLPIANQPTEQLKTSEDMYEYIDDWKEWYAEIKSGQRAFSFKGQAVEYRFKPDGTWDTIHIANPPDDALEIPEARPEPVSPSAPEAHEPQPGNADKAFRPYLIAALAGLLALAAAWFSLRRTKARK